MIILLLDGGVIHYLWIRLYWYAELSIANSKHTSAITGSVEYSMNSRPLSVSLLSRFVYVRFVLSVCLEGWVNFWTTSDRYCSTNNRLYCNRSFLSITCIDTLTALRVGFFFFCGSGSISLSFRVSIQLTLLLTLCNLFISMASFPTLSAIRIVKYQIVVCDNRIVGPSVFGVEAYTHCLLKIPLNVTLTLIGQVQSVENVLQWWNLPFLGWI